MKHTKWESTGKSKVHIGGIWYPLRRVGTGHAVVYFASETDRDRAIADHNACCGIADPEAAMEKVKDALKHFAEIDHTLECIATMITNGECSCDALHDRKIALKALTALGEEGL